MSALGHSLPGPAGRRSSNVRYAPKATVGHHNAIGRDVCFTDANISRPLRHVLKKQIRIDRFLPARSVCPAGTRSVEWASVV
jgi:hypothetical protein